MTNKTKMLPCPFCGDMPVKQKSSGDERDGYADCVSYVCKSCGCARGARGDSSKGGYADNSGVEQKAFDAWNTRAPAEDVRAVVDDPVAWRWEWKTAREHDGWCYVHQYPDAKVAHLMDIQPLYSHPQRPMVLPEFEKWYAKNVGVLGTDSAKREKQVWNACLDRIAEMNK